VQSCTENTPLIAKAVRFEAESTNSFTIIKQKAKKDLNRFFSLKGKSYVEGGG
jgi:hypothetical protein